jgi:hypothetical protein
MPSLPTGPTSSRPLAKCTLMSPPLWTGQPYVPIALPHAGHTAFSSKDCTSSACTMRKVAELTIPIQKWDCVDRRLSVGITEACVIVTLSVDALGRTGPRTP